MLVDADLKWIFMSIHYFALSIISYDNDMLIYDNDVIVMLMICKLSLFHAVANTDGSEAAASADITDTTTAAAAGGWSTPNPQKTKARAIPCAAVLVHSFARVLTDRGHCLASRRSRSRSRSSDNSTDASDTGDERRFTSDTAAAAATCQPGGVAGAISGSGRTGASLEIRWVSSLRIRINRF